MSIKTKQKGARVSGRGELGRPLHRPGHMVKQVILRGVVVLVLVCTILGALPVFAAAEDQPERSWENLRVLHEGDRIEIVGESSGGSKGTFVELTEQAISIKVNEEIRKVSRFDVQRIKSRERSRRGRNAIIGALIGAGAGLVAGLVSGASYHESGETGLFLLITMPIGVGAGAAVGASLPSYPTIYRSPR